MQRLSAGVLLVFALALAACEDRSYRDIGAEINLLTQRSDAFVPPAIRRLAAFGRRALPQLEIALHTASPAGKVNLIHALDATAQPEAAAILRHFAVYDPSPDVRTACEEVLSRWTRVPALKNAAEAALSRVAEKRAQGEGPVVLGTER
jgi:hypothetical protein